MSFIYVVFKYSWGDCDPISHTITYNHKFTKHASFSGFFCVSTNLCPHHMLHKPFANLGYEQLHGVLENIMIIWFKYVVEFSFDSTI